MKSQRGFTLGQLLIAITVFAALAFSIFQLTPRTLRGTLHGNDATSNEVRSIARYRVGKWDYVTLVQYTVKGKARCFLMSYQGGMVKAPCLE